MKLQQHLRATLIVTGLGILSVACSKKQAEGGENKEAPQPIVLTTPNVMSVPTTQDYVCRLQSRRHIEIRALNEGYLEEIPVQEGQAVRAGERLYGLYPILYRTKLEAEKAELRLTEINLENTEKLAGRGFVAPPELAKAKAERDRAKANVDRATAEVAFTSIAAPFDGIVISKDAEVGETVAPAIFGGASTRGSVVTIVDPATLEVEADINEASIGKITMGLPAEVILDALGNEKLPAETYKIVPTADRQKATVKVKVRFDKVDPRILPDMSAKITFIQKDPQAKSHQAARVTVPKSALQQREGKTVVLVLAGDRMQSQAVTAGGDFGDRVEIKQGLAGGEMLVIKGGENLSDGARVKVKAGG